MQKEQRFVIDWIIELPLYKKKEISIEEVQEISKEIQRRTGRFDQYCPECKQSSTFELLTSAEFSVQQQRLQAAATSVGRGGSNRGQIPLFPRDFNKSCRCTRNHHVLVYYFRADKNGITKVGQYPSMADIAAGDLKDFRKGLGDTELKELKRAIGLHSFGVGVGAFVYLRRIFERQIEAARQDASRDPSWDESAYDGMRTGERIRALAAYLPEILVENRAMYGILSEGVHALTEEECLEKFDIVYQGILAIAEEKTAKLERERRRRELSQSITKLQASQVK